jgi:hypothetical protein
VPEAEAFLAQLLEEKVLREDARARLVADICAVSPVPLLVRTNADETVVITEPPS